MLKGLEGSWGIPSALDKWNLKISMIFPWNTNQFIGIELDDHSWGSDALWSLDKCNDFFIRCVVISHIGWTERLRLMWWPCCVFDLKVQNIICRTGRYSMKVLPNCVRLVEVLWYLMMEPKPPKNSWWCHKRRKITCDPISIL